MSVCPTWELRRRARSAHVDNVCGFILPGREADFNVFAPDMTLEATYLAGRKVEA